MTDDYDWIKDPITNKLRVDPAHTQRAEHVAWAKERALEYCDLGDAQQAYTSLASDLTNNPLTRDHDAIMLGMMEQMSGHLSTAAEMREFIEGVQ